jgi:hypothetical protein
MLCPRGDCGKARCTRDSTAAPDPPRDDSRVRRRRLADPRNLSHEEEARLPGEIYDIAAWNMALLWGIPSYATDRAVTVAADAVGADAHTGAAAGTRRVPRSSGPPAGPGGCSSSATARK